MPDQFTDYSSQSWLGRIGGAIKGVIFGIILLPVSVILLFWNENNAVSAAKSLKEGAANVVSVSADSVAPGNDQKLIHLSGEVAAGEPIHDSLFNLSATALRLARHVEMYQWKEKTSHQTQKKLGGGEETVTTYTYDKEWSDRPIDSSKFQHPQEYRNPALLPVEPGTVYSAKATLGAFKIPQQIIAKMNGDAPLAATEESLTPLAPTLKAKAKLANNGVYVGADPNTPVVGDARITFLVINPGTFSILAQQNGDTLGPYPTQEKRDIERVESGTVSAASMFQHAESENKILAWVLRGVGFVAMFIGFACILNPLQVLADVIPFVGGIVGFGTGLLAGILAFAGSLIVIAVAWLAARPLLGGTLLVVGVAAVIHGFMRVHQHRVAAAAKAG